MAVNLFLENYIFLKKFLKALDETFLFNLSWNCER